MLLVLRSAPRDKTDLTALSQHQRRKYFKRRQEATQHHAHARVHRSSTRSATLKLLQPEPLAGARYTQQ